MEKEDPRYKWLQLWNLSPLPSTAVPSLGPTLFSSLLTHAFLTWLPPTTYLSFSPFSFLLSLPLPHLIFCPNPPHPTYPHFSFRLFLSFPPFPFKPNSREFFFLNTWAAIEVTYTLVPQENKSFHKIFPFFWYENQGQNSYMVKK